MAVTHHKSSRTIRGKTYAYGAKFVCYAANKGNGGSEGNGGSAAALTKGETYTFKGYAIDDDTGNLTSYPYLIADGLGNTRGWYRENVFPYATYSIVYNANGGTGAPSTQTKTHGTAITLSSTKPTRSGYSFQGWGTSASDTTVDYASGASYTANASITLYAIWKANTYTVKFDANGGTGAPGNQTKTHGVNLTLSKTVPTRANYTFKGWGTTSTTTSVSYAAGGTYTANTGITLYAIWSLDYVKPRIVRLKVTRCNALGTESDSGRYMHISFYWETDLEVTSVVVNWKKCSESTYSNSKTVSASGTSAGVLDTIVIIGGGVIEPHSSYDVQVVVTDGGGSSNAVKILPSQAYTIHAKPGGDGIAFGKTSELAGVADFGFDAKFNKPVYGKALGMDRLPGIPSGADLNDYIDPGCWAIQGNATAAAIKCGGVLLGSSNNVPPAVAGRFEVWSGTGTGVGSEEWSYIRQRFIPYNSANPTWERDVARGSDNVWNHYAWWKSTLTPDMSNRIYHQQKLLKSTGMVFTAGHSITLDEPISKQMHGIVLVFSAYVDGTIHNYDFISYYVPKELIASLPSKGHSFPLMRIDCYDVAVKFLYIDDTRIWGDDRNGSSGTGSNISYKNNAFVLRYVYGV